MNEFNGTFRASFTQYSITLPSRLRINLFIISVKFSLWSFIQMVIDLTYGFKWDAEGGYVNAGILKEL